MESPSTKNIFPLLYIAGAIIILFIVYKLLSGIGLIKSAEKKREDREKEAAVNMLRTDDYFNPQYYKKQIFKRLSPNQIGSLAYDLHRAVMLFGTDEEKIFSIFNNLYNKCNISQLSEEYYNLYNENLQELLLSELNEKDITKLMNIINDLPNN